MKKGFVSLIFILLLLSIIFFVFQQEVSFNASAFKAIEFFFQSENAFFERSVIEENIDFLVKKTIESELRAKNISSKKINKKVAEKLDFFFTRLKEKGVFFSVNDESFDKTNLSNSFKVTVLAVSEHIFIAFFNVLPTSKIHAFKEESMLFQQIFLPSNYMQEVLVIV